MSNLAMPDHLIQQLQHKQVKHALLCQTALGLFTGLCCSDFQCARQEQVARKQSKEFNYSEEDNKLQLSDYTRLANLSFVQAEIFLKEMGKREPR